MTDSSSLQLFYFVQSHVQGSLARARTYVDVRNVRRHLVGMSSKWLHGINWLGLSVSTVFYTNIEIIMTISIMLL